MNDVVYPAILTYEDDVIYVSLPNFSDEKCLTYGDTLEEAIKSAKEVLTLDLSDLLQEKKEFPKPLDIKELKTNLDENQEVIYVSLWLPYELSLIKTIYKKKTLSIPTWLDLLATYKNINFSQVLKEALMEKLNIK